MGIVTADIAITLDGFGAGPGQSQEHPLGHIDEKRLHGWMFDHADEHADELASILEAKAYVMGRNMFSPGRGEWDLDWRGWWGDEPPYRGPVFVLTHHERPPLEMEGGTTFHFHTGGTASALDRARQAAGDGDVAIAGGASTINHYLAVGSIDELRLHVAPFVSGVAGSDGGSRLFEGVPDLDLEPVAARQTPHVTHLTYRRPRR